MNNKGFAISSVLYIMMASFLMYLAVLLSQLSSSADIIGNAANDLIDKGFSAYINESESSDEKIIILKDDKKIVWPKDFKEKDEHDGVKIECNEESCVDKSLDTINKIKITCDGYNDITFENITFD